MGIADLRIPFDTTRSARSARIVALCVMLFLLARSAWIGDDAFVTLKTALNAAHGWGVGFNATENVQGYTSPIWFLTWLFVEQTTQWSIFGMLFLSLVLSALAVSLLLWIAPNVGSILLVAVALVASNAFFEFSSGGLENPMAYLLVGLLVLLTRDPGCGSAFQCAMLGLVASAVVLTRFDLVLVILPIGLWSLWSMRTNPKKLLGLLLALVIPIAIWCVWSLATYSSLLPNTFLAKTNVVIPRLEIITQGILYLWVSLSQDPVTLFIVLTFLVVACVSRQLPVMLWAAGVLAYLTYIVWVGGDYMAGRFLSVPVFVSIALLALNARRVVSREAQENKVSPVTQQSLLVGLLITVGAVSFWGAIGKVPTALDPPEGPRWDFSRSYGVADEIGFVAERGWTLSALMESHFNPDIPKDNWLGVIATSANMWPNKTSEIQYPVDIWGPDCIWIADGITLGPLTHQIVDCPLTDRFLAQISFEPESPFGWRPGHLRRTVPDGYVDAVKFGDATLVVDPDEAARLDALWDSIRVDGQ